LERNGRRRWASKNHSSPAFVWVLRSERADRPRRILEVWKAAHHERPNRVVVVKVALDPDFRRQLCREGFLPDLDHPNVVPIIDSDTRFAEVPYVVMRKRDGFACFEGEKAQASASALLVAPPARAWRRRRAPRGSQAGDARSFDEPGFAYGQLHADPVHRRPPRFIPLRNIFDAIELPTIQRFLPRANKRAFHSLGIQEARLAGA